MPTRCCITAVRWWSTQPGVEVTRFTAEQFTEATLVDYVRAQLAEQPRPAQENINNRLALLRRLFRFYFQQDMPHAPYRLERTWYRRSPLGYGRGRVVTSADLKVKGAATRHHALIGRAGGALLEQFPHGARSSTGGFDVAQWLAPRARCWR